MLSVGPGSSIAWPRIEARVCVFVRACVRACACAAAAAPLGFPIPSPAPAAAGGALRRQRQRRRGGRRRPARQDRLKSVRPGAPSPQRGGGGSERPGAATAARAGPEGPVLEEGASRLRLRVLGFAGGCDNYCGHHRDLRGSDGGGAAARESIGPSFRQAALPDFGGAARPRAAAEPARVTSAAAAETAAALHGAPRWPLR
jgi:hypothetical protein